MTWQTLPDPQLLDAIGARVRALRLERELSQAALAEHAGVSLPTVQRLEAGRGKPSAETLLRVLRSLRKLDALEATLAPAPVSPMALIRDPERRRQRAPRRRSPERGK